MILSVQRAAGLKQQQHFGHVGRAALVALWGVKPLATEEGDDRHCAISGVSSAGCVHVSKDAVK